MRVLGIDPGTVATGWGLVEERGSRLVHHSSGVIRCRGALPIRLARIHEQLQGLIVQLSPGLISLEKSFVGMNIQSAFRLGEARGVILAAAAQADIPVHEYSPAEVKAAVAGGGRATKDQMQRMVGRLLAIDRVLLSDEADAIALAICHLHRNRLAGHPALQGAAPRRRGSARAAWARLAGVQISNGR